MESSPIPDTEQITKHLHSDIHFNHACRLLDRLVATLRDKFGEDRSPVIPCPWCLVQISTNPTYNRLFYHIALDIDEEAIKKATDTSLRNNTEFIDAMAMLQSTESGSVEHYDVLNSIRNLKRRTRLYVETQYRRWLSQKAKDVVESDQAVLPELVEKLAKLKVFAPHDNISELEAIETELRATAAATSAETKSPRWKRTGMKASFQ